MGNAEYSSRGLTWCGPISWVALLVLLGATGCSGSGGGPASPGDDAAPEGNGVITGTMTSFLGVPAPDDVYLHLFSMDDWALVASPEMAADGTFSVHGLPDGDYWMSVFVEGMYPTARYLPLVGAPVSADVKLIPRSGAQDPGRDGKADDLDDQMGPLSVHVIDVCTDEPVGGATVTAIEMKTGVTHQGTTDLSGGAIIMVESFWSYDPDTFLTYQVVPSGVTLQKYIPCSTDQVTMFQGLGMAELKLIPKEEDEQCYGEVEGTVTDCAGDPLVDIIVSVVGNPNEFGCETNAALTYLTHTDAAGDYTLEKVTVGSALIAAEPLEAHFHECSHCWWPMEEQVLVETDDSATLDFELPRKGVRFKGKVVSSGSGGEPVEGALVRIKNETPYPDLFPLDYPDQYTDSAGEFTFEPDPPMGTSGEVIVEIIHPELEACDNETTDTICDWYLEGDWELVCLQQMLYKQITEEVCDKLPDMDNHPIYASLSFHGEAMVDPMEFIELPTNEYDEVKVVFDVDYTSQRTLWSGMSGIELVEPMPQMLDLAGTLELTLKIRLVDGEHCATIDYTIIDNQTTTVNIKRTDTENGDTATFPLELKMFDVFAAPFSEGSWYGCGLPDNMLIDVTTKSLDGPMPVLDCTHSTQIQLKVSE